MRHPNPDLLLYIALGDALGISVEYLRPEKHLEHILKAITLTGGYLGNPKYNIPGGRYTDDTEMSLAVANVLLEWSPPYRPLNFAHAFVRQFHMGSPGIGYVPGFQMILEQSKNGHDLLTYVGGKSDRNGAAMRAVPLGVLPDPKDILEIARVQAVVTHDSPAGIFSAQAVALMSHFALYTDEPLSKMGAFLAKHFAEDVYARKQMKRFKEQLYHGNIRSRKKWGGEPSSVNTVHAVLTLVPRCDSLMDLMRCLMLYGGDTDTAGAIAFGIASTRYDDLWLPVWALRELEADNEVTGKAYLKQVGEMLMEKYAAR